MRVIDISCYLDGGTIKVTTDEGDFSFDRRIQSTTKDRLYAGYPSKDNSNIIEDSEELETRIIEALKLYQPRESYRPTLEQFLNSRG